MCLFDRVVPCHIVFFFQTKIIIIPLTVCVDHLANWMSTESSKECLEANDLSVLNEGTVSRHNWVESFALQFAN